MNYTHILLTIMMMVKTFLVSSYLNSVVIIMQCFFYHQHQFFMFAEGYQNHIVVNHKHVNGYSGVDVGGGCDLIHHEMCTFGQQQQRQRQRPDQQPFIRPLSRTSLSFYSSSNVHVVRRYSRQRLYNELPFHSNNVNSTTVKSYDVAPLPITRIRNNEIENERIGTGLFFHKINRSSSFINCGDSTGSATNTAAGGAMTTATTKEKSNGSAALRRLLLAIFGLLSWGYGQSATTQTATNAAAAAVTITSSAAAVAAVGGAPTTTTAAAATATGALPTTAAAVVAATTAISSSSFNHVYTMMAFFVVAIATNTGNALSSMGWGNGILSFATWYMHNLHTFPLLTKAITAGVIGITGDYIAQWIEYALLERKKLNKNKNFITNNISSNNIVRPRIYNNHNMIRDVLSINGHYHLRRGLSILADGVLISGPLMHIGYQYFEMIMPVGGGGISSGSGGGIGGMLRSSAAVAAMSHVLADSIILDSIFIASTFVMTGLFEGYTVRQLIPQFKVDYIPSLKASWMTSIALMPIEFVCFRFLPLSFRVLAVNFIDVVWDAVISYMAHRNRNINKNHYNDHDKDQLMVAEPNGSSLFQQQHREHVNHSHNTNLHQQQHQAEESEKLSLHLTDLPCVIQQQPHNHLLQQQPIKNIVKNHQQQHRLFLQQQSGDRCCCVAGTTATTVADNLIQSLQHQENEVVGVLSSVVPAAATSTTATIPILNRFEYI